MPQYTFMPRLCEHVVRTCLGSLKRFTLQATISQSIQNSLHALRVKRRSESGCYYIFLGIYICLYIRNRYTNTMYNYVRSSDWIQYDIDRQVTINFLTYKICSTKLLKLHIVPVAIFLEITLKPNVISNNSSNSRQN